MLQPGPASDRPEVLELGSGGGHLASHLADRFALTLVDLSAPMLAVSRRLNPGASHEVGDMRTVRLHREFDAVLIHDAIDYMTTEADLAAAIATAYAHCRPGGRVVIVPDDVMETFEERTEHGGTDGADGRAIRFLSWSYDPDPADSETLTQYTFMLRAADGGVAGGLRNPSLRTLQPGDLAPAAVGGRPERQRPLRDRRGR